MVWHLLYALVGLRDGHFSCDIVNTAIVIIIGLSPAPLFFCNSTYCACVVQIFRDFRGKLISELLEVKVVPKTQARRCTAYEVESLMLSRRPSSFRVVSGGRVRRARNKTRQKTRMRAPTLRLNEQKVGLTNHADLSLLYSPLFSVDRYAENSYQKPHQEENPLS